MPFTLAHPAAAVPLRRLLGRHGVLSALVIGSVAPDLWYFLPLGLRRADTHSVDALFWFCLPAGLLIYVTFHALLKRPLLALFPAPLSMRLAAAGSLDSLLPRASWTAVTASLAAGALTHLAWDAFTHDDGLATRLLPALGIKLASIGRYEVYGYSLLQHGSTLLGMALLASWIRRWFENPMSQRIAPQTPLHPHARWLVLGVWAMAAFLGATYAMLTVTHAGEGLSAARALAKSAAGSAGAGLGAALIAYGILWHLMRRSGRGSA